MRISVLLEYDKKNNLESPFEFFIELPCRLAKGDIVFLSDFIIGREKEFTEKQLFYLDTKFFTVSLVSFKRDGKGVYQEVDFDVT